jgi:hypothetical protein
MRGAKFLHCSMNLVSIYRVVYPDMVSVLQKKLLLPDFVMLLFFSTLLAGFRHRHSPW